MIEDQFDREKWVPDLRITQPQFLRPKNYANKYVIRIPDICHFFYTGKIFGE